MFKYFLKKLLVLLPKLLIITVIIFWGMELMPGNNITRTLDPEAVALMSPEQLQSLIEAKGLDKPTYIRYFYWLRDLLSGDFGYSITNGTSVAVLLRQRLPATIELAALGILFSSFFGIIIGMLASIKKDTALDYSVTLASLMGTSIPDFFICMIFLLVFAINLKWLPSGGRTSISDQVLITHIKHLILPTITLSLGLTTGLMRYTRNSMLDVMGKDYIKTARAKGLRESTVYMRHCFRNGCAPVMLMLIGRLGMLISGTAVTELIFNYPGMGQLFLTALSGKDTPVAMTILLFTSACVLITTFLADIVLAALDPRVRFGEE